MNINPGDIVLFQSSGFMAWAIRRVQLRLGFCESEAKYVHVAIIINKRGDLLESLGKYGVVRRNIFDYKSAGRKFIVLRKPYANGDEIANAAVQLARTRVCNQQNLSIEHPKYDWLLILALWLVSFGWPRGLIKEFDLAKHYICSEFVLTAFRRANAEFTNCWKKYYPAFFRRLAFTGRLVIVHVETG